MSEQFTNMQEQAAAFQKLWLGSMAKVMQAAFTVEQSAPPPELLKQIRSGILHALAQSWDEFMRTPQFTEAMKQWMDNAIHFRKLTNEIMGKARSELQAASRDDVDNIILSVRHMEKRLLDRLDELAQEVAMLKAEKTSPAKRTNGKPARTRKQRRAGL